MHKEIKICDLHRINQPFEQDILNSINKVIAQGRFIGGPFVHEFENALSTNIGVDFAVGVGNGLDALKLSLISLITAGFLNKGNKILVSANTYIASVLSIIHAGLIPVPVDVDPKTMTVTGDTIRQALEYNNDIKGIMLVHLYGRAAWDNDIKQIINERQLIVIEDNAQAIGAISEETGLFSSSKQTGALGHIAAFSFYPTKNIGAIGDAGAVTTSIPELASIVRALGNYGSLKRFNNVYLGFNSRLDPVQAVVLIHKYKFIDKINSLRRRNASILEHRITSNYITKPFFRLNDASMVWHQYVVTLKQNIEREHFRNYLNKNGIETDIHYPLTPFEQPCMINMYAYPINDTIAYHLSRHIVSIPVNQTLDCQDMEYIAQVINNYTPI